MLFLEMEVSSRLHVFLFGNAPIDRACGILVANFIDNFFRDSSYARSTIRCFKFLFSKKIFDDVDSLYISDDSWKCSRPVEHATG